MTNNMDFKIIEETIMKGVISNNDFALECIGGDNEWIPLVRILVKDKEAQEERYVQTTLPLQSAWISLAKAQYEYIEDEEMKDIFKTTFKEFLETLTEKYINSIIED